MSGLLWAIPLLIAGMVASAAVAASDAPSWMAWVLRVAVIAVAIWGGLVWPLLHWGAWRYEVRHEEIDLLRGVLVVTRTLVPMTRVQHVDTQRNPIADLFDLRTVKVHTAAGSHDIPALRPAAAAAIRDRIALLARTPDDL